MILQCDKHFTEKHVKKKKCIIKPLEKPPCSEFFSSIRSICSLETLQALG